MFNEPVWDIDTRSKPDDKQKSMSKGGSILTNLLYSLINSRKVTVSQDIKLSSIDFQYGRHEMSIWKNEGSRSKSNTSLRHAFFVYCD